VEHEDNKGTPGNQAAPNIDEALCGSDGMATYDESLKTNLDTETKRISALPGFFQKSMVTQILYADRENQYGSPEHVVQVVGQYVGKEDDLNSCAVVTVDKNKILEAMIWKNPDDHSQGNAPYYKRYAAVRDIVREGAPNAGRMGCH